MANKSLSSINFKLRADIKQFSTGLQNAERKMKKFAKKMDRMGRNMTRNFTAPLAGMAALSVMAWDKQANAIAQVEAGLKSTGNQVGKTSKELQKMASDLQKKTIFGDEEILKNATAQLLTFTNITGQQFERTQQAALDLATRLDGDLKSASIQLGKALNDPVANLSALSRSGIQFSKDQKALINSLWETGRTAEAQTIILQELEKQYGGSAEAAAKAGAGGIKQLKNSIGDLAEVFGKIILEYITPFIEKIKGMTQRFLELSDRTKKNIITFAALTAAIGPALIIVSKLTEAYITLRKTLFKTGAAMALFGTKLLRLSAAGLKANGIIGATTGVLRVLKTVVIANPIGALVVGLTTVIGLFKKFRKTVKGSTSDLESFDAASLTAAQRLAEINKELDNSGKTSLELKKEELNLTKDLIAENLKAANIKLSGGVDEFGDDLSNMDVAYLRTQISNLEGDLTDYENTITRLTKKINDLKDPQGLSKFQPLKPSYAEDWGVDFNDVDWDKINAKQNEFAPLKPSYADQWGIDFNNVDFKTPLDGLTAKLEGITSKITGFAKKWGDHFGAAFSVIGQSLENQSIALDDFHAKESESIANSNMNAEEKAEAQLELDEKVAEKRKSILRKQAIADKAAAIISAVINGAQAITKVSAQTGIGAIVAAPLMTALIAAQIALIAAQPIPQFAAGGIVSGPTLGIMGEYAGAKSNPEVIAPLNKLKSMLPGGGTETVIPDVRITGEDLLIVFERANRRKARR